MASPNYLGTDRYIGVFDLDGSLKLREQSGDPATPEASSLKVYSKAQGGVSALFYENDAGTVINLSGGLTGSGTANRLAYWTAADTLAANAALTQNQLVVPDANGLPAGFASLYFDSASNLTLLVGASSIPGVAGGLSSAIVNLPRTTTGGPSYYSVAVGTGNFPNYQGRMARGLTSGLTATQTDDILCRHSGIGYGASQWAASRTAAIDFCAAENYSNTAMATYITFGTTPTGGSVTIAERFRIGPAGQWGIGGATYGTAGNLFRSGGPSAAPTWLDHTTDFLSQYLLLAGRSGGQVAKGGTGVTDVLTLVGTSGNGTATSPAIQLNVGNNGGTNAITIINNGKVGILTNPPAEALDVTGNFKITPTGGGGALTFNINGSDMSFSAAQNLAFNCATSVGTGQLAFHVGRPGLGEVATKFGDNSNNFPVSFNTNTQAEYAQVILQSFYNGGGSQPNFNKDYINVNSISTTGGDVLRLDSVGNLMIGSATGPSAGTKSLMFGVGTAPTMAGATAGLYAVTVSGITHLIAIASDGTKVQVV